MEVESEAKNISLAEKVEQNVKEQRRVQKKKTQKIK